MKEQTESMKTDPSQEHTFQTGNVLLITLSHLLNDMYAAFVAPLLPLLIHKLGLHRPLPVLEMTYRIAATLAFGAIPCALFLPGKAAASVSGRKAENKQV